MPQNEKQKQEPQYVEHPLGEMELVITGLQRTEVGEEVKDHPGNVRAVPAWNVTLTAIWPEQMAPQVLAAAREHRLRVKLMYVEEVSR